MNSNTGNRGWKLGIASALGAAALAAPATAPADVSVRVGSTNVSLPVLKCERTSVGTGESQTVTVPEIRVPVTVGPIIPSLGAVNVSIGEDDTSVPISGQAIDITVDGNLVNERDAATTPDHEVSGPDAQPVERTVTLPASAELVGATTPEDIAASSCAQPAEDPAEEPAPEPQPEPQPQPESQPQPEQPQANAPAAQQNTPASTQQTPASDPQHRPATTGQDKAKKSKNAKRSKKKAKKSKPKRKKSKGRSKNRRR